MSRLGKRLTKLERDTGAQKGRLFVCDMLPETWADETASEAAIEEAFVVADIEPSERDVVIITGICRAPIGYDTAIIDRDCTIQG